MGATGTTGYNLNHVQIAEQGSSPTFRDVNYSITADFTIDQSDEKLAADGANVESTFGPREGSGSISFGSIDLQTVAMMTGDEFMTDGADETLVERLEFKGDTVPPGVIVAAWVRNVSSQSPFAGTMVIVPNAKFGVPNVSFEQSSWSEAEADVTFDQDEDGNMLIWENIATEPTFTNGVMPVNLVAPGP